MLDDEELPLVSSSPLLTTAPITVKPQDEIDLPTLKKVQFILDNQITYCRDNETIDLSEAEFTVKEQLYLNRRLADRLTQVKLLVDTVIENVREKYE